MNSHIFKINLFYLRKKLLFLHPQTYERSEITIDLLFSTLFFNLNQDEDNQKDC